MLGLAIEETTTTTGTVSSLALAAVSQRSRVADQFGVGDPVSYLAIDGAGNMEWARGRAGAGNTLLRPSVIVASLVGGVWTEGGSPINLSGTTTIRVVEHLGAAASSVPAIRTPAAAAYYNPAAVTTNVGGTLALVANRLFAVPIKAPEYPTLTGLGCVVTAAVAGTCYLGVTENYIDANGRMQPGRVLGTASVSTSTTGIKTDTASYVPKLKPGHQYWALVEGTVAATIRALGTTGPLNQLGFSTADGITPNQCLYSDLGAAPWGSDLSGTTFGLTSSLSGVPHVFFTS